MTHCSNCKVELNGSAIVDFFLQDPEWVFWGEEGKRWIVCKTKEYVHFKIKDRQNIYHRLAVIRK